MITPNVIPMLDPISDVAVVTSDTNASLNPILIMK
jgi:hypothetical protein